MMKVSNHGCSTIRKQIFLAFHHVLPHPASTGGLRHATLADHLSGQQAEGSSGLPPSLKNQILITLASTQLRGNIAAVASC